MSGNPVHDTSPSKCRVCRAGEAGQRLHKCPDSPYYVAGSDPGAEMPRCDCSPYPNHGPNAVPCTCGEAV